MSSQVEDALMAVRTQLAQRRLRLNDYFDDFDRLRNGRVTIDQFTRVLSSNYIRLTPEQLQSLLDTFNAAAVAAATRGASAAAAGATAGKGQSVGAGTLAAAAAAAATDPQRATMTAEEAQRAQRDGSAREVNYAAFLAAVHAAAAPRELTTATQRRPATLEQAEEDRLEKTTRMLQHAVQAQSILLVPPFKDLDPRNEGKVTKTQFARCIPFRTLDPHVIDLYAKKFGDGQGNVFYMPWCRLMDPTLRAGSESAAAAGGGSVAAGSGVRAARGLGATDGSAAAGTADGEGGGGGEDEAVRTMFFSGSYRNPGLTADALVRLFREQFALYKLRCDDYFADFDKFKTGLVTASEFESAIGRLKFVKFALTPENVDTLLRAYEADPGDPADAQSSNNPNPKINYRAFLYDTNPKNFPCVSADGKESANYFISTHAPDTFITTPKEQAAVAALMERIRKTIEADRIYLTPVFRDFDKVRKSVHEQRTCTASRFARTLATQKLILPAEELRLLIRKYAVPAADGTPSDDINYYQFIQDVDPTQIASFHGNDGAGAAAAGGATGGAKGAKSSAARSVGGTAAGAAGAGGVEATRFKSATADTRLQAATSLEDILLKIALQANTRHLRVGEFFLDFDPLRCGRIHKDKFATALNIGGVQLVGSELETLQRSYAAGDARGRENEVDVASFLQDLARYTPDSSDNTASLFAGSVAARSRSVVEESKQGAAAASPSRARMSTVAADSAAAERVSGARFAQLQRVLQRLRHATDAHSALLTPFFSDFDKHNKGKITKTHFLQALARHRFVLSEEERNLLCDYYAVPHDPESMDYRRFVRDVGQNEGQLRRTDNSNAADVTGGNDGNGAGARFFSGGGGGADDTTINSNSIKGRSTTVARSDVPAAEPGSEAALQAVLAKLACFIQERGPRVGEFYRDGDELRHQHVSKTRFRHCVGMIGVADLTEEEFCALEEGFASGCCDGDVDYPAFVHTLKEMIRAGDGRAAVAERRKGNTAATVSLRDTVNYSDAFPDTDDNNNKNNNTDGAGSPSSTQKRRKNRAAATEAGAQLRLKDADRALTLEERQYLETMAAVRRALAARRVVSLPAFREYDPARRGGVKEGQFFAVLTTLGVRLSPAQAACLCRAYDIGNGEMGYIRFCEDVDDQAFARMS